MDSTWMVPKDLIAPEAVCIFPMRVCHAKCESVVEMRFKTKGLLKNTFAVENSPFISDKCNMRECLGYHCFRQWFVRLIGIRPLPEPVLIQLCIRSGVFNDVSYIVCVLFIISSNGVYMLLTSHYFNNPSLSPDYVITVESLNFLRIRKCHDH